MPCNPDLFRSIHMNSLRAGDVLVAITQSGETKDLVDILNQVREKFAAGVSVIAVVNNENSTIPQEKADFFLPLLCGPEIAVAATKSFNAQLALFYLLAAGLNHEAALAQQKLEKIKHLIGYTLKACEEDITAVMLKFFLKPSIHILGTSLIGLAREGALKIREVVLNHAEGYDAAEFKHGPNTILGKNTLYSFTDMESAAGRHGRVLPRPARRPRRAVRRPLPELGPRFQIRRFQRRGHGQPRKPSRAPTPTCTAASASR